jgi:hypothetical protein
MFKTVFVLIVIFGVYGHHGYREVHRTLSTYDSPYECQNAGDVYVATHPGVRGECLREQVRVPAIMIPFPLFHPEHEGRDHREHRHGRD